MKPGKAILKRLRTAFREGVFQRDQHRCRVCGRGGELDAHHITDRHLLPADGYVVENGISLCSGCHRKAECWHESGGVRWEPGFHPDELYARIGSSREVAEQACQALLEKLRRGGEAGRF